MTTVLVGDRPAGTIVLMKAITEETSLSVHGAFVLQKCGLIMKKRVGPSPAAYLYLLTRIFDVPDKRVVLIPHCSRVLHHGPNPPRARDGPEGHDHLTCAPCRNDAYHRGIASRTMTPSTPQIAFSSVGHHASPTPAPNFFGSSRGRSVLRSFGHRVPFSIDHVPRGRPGHVAGWAHGAIPASSAVLIQRACLEHRICESTLSIDK